MQKRLQDTEHQLTNVLAWANARTDSEAMEQADVAIQDFITGDTRNIHETMLAVGKADLAFRLTMQVRNKMVEAYQEVMRMQV